ncbi:uncharacterized protein LOC115885342 [Sitophilus oryzae]|uniref:Uncharacterized protein LOC115885342 n=1 Tax=Sitophilus oryzae TaxID=7048 RepID=A0A6J2YA16_SITOR|nr:uncharacterized protein LOC115885342 [Sitophilus oryzae]
MDVPFAVPPDIDIFFKSKTKTKRNVLERKNFLEKMEDFLTIMGFNGSSCIKRLLCESDDFVKMGGKSLLRDLIGLLFRSFSDGTDFEEYENACFSDNFTSCNLSLLDIFINSSYNGVVNTQYE